MAEICWYPGLRSETLRQAQDRLWGTRIRDEIAYSYLRYLPNTYSYLKAIMGSAFVARRAGT